MSRCPFSTSRRGLFGAAGGLLAGGAALGTGLAAPLGRAPAGSVNPAASALAGSSTADGQVPFYGPHQGGIETPQQIHTVFASFDLTTRSASDVVRLLQDWTRAAARLTAGQSAEPLGGAANRAPADSGETVGLGARRLTLTFGFGPGLFERDGRDRYGLARQRPPELADLPAFAGDQLDPARSGGDLCIQACADDSFVAFHAIRQLARMAAADDAAMGYGGKRPGATAASGAHQGTARLRWLQTGFLPDSPSGETPRNLLGFKDGTQNPGSMHMAERANGRLSGNGSFDDVVWVDPGGPDWMRGGSYLVARRIRLALEHWDRTELDFQEQVIGRRKASGAPLTGLHEDDPLDLDATDADGNPVIAQNAHVRLGAASQAQGARILRRTYSYNDGLGMVAERWPPWRQGLEYDAGLLFIAYQQDPRAGFTRMFEQMSRLDLLNQYATHVGSGLFACPGGVAAGEFIGQKLFANA
ncbi:Dyp-type peroxidase [Lichenicoccus sp.]|uniref:Dyp-type peroxidase n=1 Tax=Lichenicoccus sp. TaxID=2781899 RepID=UPI003D129D50